MSILFGIMQGFSCFRDELWCFIFFSANRRISDIDVVVLKSETKVRAIDATRM